LFGAAKPGFFRPFFLGFPEPSVVVFGSFAPIHGLAKEYCASNAGAKIDECPLVGDWAI